MNMLENVLDELSKYNRSRKDLRFLYINDRLTKSLKSYYSEIVNDYDFVNKKDSARVLKKFGCDVCEK